MNHYDLHNHDEVLAYELDSDEKISPVSFHLNALYSIPGNVSLANLSSSGILINRLSSKISTHRL